MRQAAQNHDKIAKTRDFAFSQLKHAENAEDLVMCGEFGEDLVVLAKPKKTLQRNEAFPMNIDVEVLVQRENLGKYAKSIGKYDKIRVRA